MTDALAYFCLSVIEFEKGFISLTTGRKTVQDPKQIIVCDVTNKFDWFDDFCSNEICSKKKRKLNLVLLVDLSLLSLELLELL